MPITVKTPTKNDGVALLLTGDELMRGDTVDSNSAGISQTLGEHRILVREKVTVGDDKALLLAVLGRLVTQYRVVIMNGGLGPTSDDLTAEIVAEVADVPLETHPEALAHVEAWCHRRHIEPNAANLKQAQIPQGAALVPNPVGSATGFAAEIGGCLVITTPGVPSELRAMLPEVTARVMDRVGGGTTHTRRLQTFGIGESTIEQRLGEDTTPWPQAVTLGFRAGMPQLELKLNVASDHDLPALDACEARLQDLLGDHILGPGETTLAAALQTALSARGATMTTAESCTGGLIASMMTQEPGASAVLGGAFVTYSNRCKRDLLGVDASILQQHGAVSEPVVTAMLEGALARTSADVGVAVSGIAGPDGGTPDKPVGTVWLAWGSRQQLHTRRLVVPGSRQLFQTLVAAAGLDLIRRDLLGLPREPHYFSRQSV